MKTVLLIALSVMMTIESIEGMKSYTNGKFTMNPLVQKTLFLNFLSYNPPINNGRKNACLPSNRSPSQFTNRMEYLEEFTRGPCSPVLIVPGILGSKLRVKINCIRFYRNFPHIFKSCGWRFCKSIFLFSPSKEYTIWIPGITGSSKGFFLKPNSCLVELLYLRINTNFKASTIKDYPKSKQKPWLVDTWQLGFKIVPYGLTSHTKKNKRSKCGFRAMSDMISGIKLKSASYMKGVMR